MNFIVSYSRLLRVACIKGYFKVKAFSLENVATYGKLHNFNSYRCNE